MNAISHIVRFAAACLLLALGACGGGGDADSSAGPQLETMVRWWSFNTFHDGAVGEVRLGDERAQVGGAVQETVEFGSMVLFPPLQGPKAKGEVFSTKTGETYWVSTQAPGAALGTGAAIGSSAQLAQYQYFRKTTANATLRVVVSKVFMEAIDENGGDPTALECPWHRPGAKYFDCHRVMSAWVDFDLTAYSFFDQTTLLKTGGFADLLGWQGNWYQDAYTHGDATIPFWNNASFILDPDIEGNGGGHSALDLASPISIDVPLSSVPVGELFYLYAGVKASALNHRQRESYLTAYFRDPQQLDGLQFSFAGLEPVQTPTEKPPNRAPAPAPACTTGPDPQAGTLQFDAATYEDPELPGDGATVIVTRSGGSRGAVSVRLATSDGTAVAGAHYTPVTTQVLFADGEMGSRAVRIPIIVDAVAEADRTVNLTLSAAGGCATLGAQSSAVLTIMDDDRPPPPPPPSGLDTTFGNAGKATSTEVNGDRLTAFGGDRSAMALQADGKIVMVGGTFTDFILARFNADGGLDPGFGVSGKVTTDMGSGLLPEEATGVAIQPDGKIVVVGYTVIPNVPPAPSLSPTFALVRYNADGSLDTSFGSGGRVSNNVNGRAYAVAIQGDGKIVVAGEFSFGSTNVFSDFTVARFNANGNLDASFGPTATGQVVTSFASFGIANSSARNVVLQPNGAIVVSGKPLGNSAGFDHTDMARYQPNGFLDPSFGNGGQLTLPGALVGEGLALQSDGKFVLAGSVTVGTSPAPSTRFALMRLNADGSADSSFGSAGTVSTAFTVNAAVAGVALQGDGKIVAVGTTVLAVNPNFVVARYNADGSIDTGFGNGGNLLIDFFGFTDIGESVLVQPDGKIVVGGQAQHIFDGYGLARINP